MFIVSRLPQIASVDQQVLDKYQANPELAISKPTYMKHLKQAAEVLQPDTPPPVETINIKNLQVLLRADFNVNRQPGQPDGETDGDERLIEVRPGKTSTSESIVSK